MSGGYVDKILALARGQDDQALQLGAVRPFERESASGKVEHVGGYDRDSVAALHEHMQLAELAFERGDERGALEHLQAAREHVKAGPGGGNATVHGVNHRKGKHDKTQHAMVSALGSAAHDKDFGTNYGGGLHKVLD